MPLWHTPPGCLAYFHRRSILACFVCTCGVFTGSYRRYYRYVHNKPHTAELQAERTDLLRQFFNYWIDSGNTTKVIKRQFRDKLRAYNTPLVVLFKHIAVFDLEIARFRNKSISHIITPLSFYYCQLWQKSAAGR